MTASELGAKVEFLLVAPVSDAGLMALHALHEDVMRQPDERRRELIAHECWEHVFKRYFVHMDSLMKLSDEELRSRLDG